MRITLWGFYQYDPTLFDDVTLPEDLTKSYVVDEILKRSGDLFPYHQQPAFLKRNINQWFSRNYLQFEKMIEALMAEYSPIENYDRHEEYTSTPGVTKTQTHSGTDKDYLSGSDEDVHSGKDTREIESTPKIVTTTVTENEVSAYDSSTYSPHDKSTVTVTPSGQADKSKDEFTHGEKIKTEYGKKSDFTYGHKIEDTVTGFDKNTGRIHGNIGVKTSQSMILEELELRKIDIYTLIARLFEKEFLIQIY